METPEAVHLVVESVKNMPNEQAALVVRAMTLWSPSGLVIVRVDAHRCTVFSRVAGHGHADRGSEENEERGAHIASEHRSGAFAHPQTVTRSSQTLTLETACNRFVASMARSARACWGTGWLQIGLVA